MTTVFVAGSRAISRLSSKITERLDNIIAKRFTVLVGDANGVDKAVQSYLAKQSYRDVFVYGMETCRNNIGDWPVREHTASKGTRHDRHYYGIKDMAMARDASCGFMLWDGESKGTLTNVVNLLNFGKKVLLYLGPEKSFFALASFDDLHNALQSSQIADPESMLSAVGVNRQPTLHLR